MNPSPPLPCTLPQEKLVEFSGEHLYYELDMLFGTVELLVKGVTDPYVYNALLESFILHASIVLDFFYAPAVKADDARAVHYIKDVAGWQKALPPFHKLFGGFVKKRNKRVVHLSYKRLEVAPGERRWGSPKMAQEIRRIVDLFLRYADPELLAPRLYSLRSAGRNIRPDN